MVEAQETIWTLWRRNFLLSQGFEHKIVQPAITTTLSRVPTVSTLDFKNLTGLTGALYKSVDWIIFRTHVCGK